MIKEPPPWISLLTPMQVAWRENELLKGREPDSYIEERLREAGQWPLSPRPKA
jgi:hypothetical protein